MANITLGTLVGTVLTPANLSSPIQLGISEASLDNKTIAVALTSFLNTVRVGYADVKQQLSTSPLSAWVVTSVETMPAPTAANPGATTQVVSFQNGTRELILDGALSNTGSTFSLAVTGMRMVGADYDFGLALSAPATGTPPWTVKFVQGDSGKIYETQLDYYNGQVTQTATTVGALPIGAKLTDIGGTPKVNAVPPTAGKPAVPEVPADPVANLPTSFTQVGLDIDNGHSSLALGGSFNINKITGALTGSLTTLQDVFEPEGGLGLAVRTFNVTNGSIASTSSSATLGMFNSTALPSIQLVKEQQTDDTASVNFGSQQFVFPTQGTSTTTFSYVSGETALLLGQTDASQLELGAFAGNDTITVSSNTDVTIFAGAGNDTVTAGVGNDIIYGGKGNDVLNGAAGNDLFMVNHMGAEGSSTNQANAQQTTTGIVGGVTYTYKTNLLNRDVIDGGAGNDVLSFDALPGDLQLIQPAQWAARVGGATGPGATVDSYVTAAGVFGKLVSTSGNERTYGEIQAPATDSIGFVFKNSDVNAFGLQNEYVQVKNVEYLEIATGGVLATYDIRPLYLATSEQKNAAGVVTQSGADTMFAFTRQAFDDLVGVLDLGTSTGDPLSWYRNQFSIVTFEGTGKEWRYYMNSGSGNDTLYGTRDLNTETNTDLITLGNGIVKESLLNLNLTKGSVTKSISIDVDAKDSSGAFLYLDAQSNVDFGKLNTKLLTELNNVNVGISAQRFNDNLKVVVSGLDQSGWTLASTSNLVSVGPNPETIKDTGRDLLDGGVGADTMIGYGGSDSYYVDNAADQVIESGWHSGFDVVMVSAPAPKTAADPAFTYTLQADSAVERLQVHQIIAGDNGNLYGEPRATAPTSATTPVNLRGNNFTYEFLGHDGANTITAGQFSGITPRLDPTGGALLMGMGGNDSLVGGDLNDHFFGGTGADTLQGGAGDDSFYMGFAWSGAEITGLLLPEQYKLLGQLGAYDRPDFLSGGNDVAIGGAGYDVVVVGLDFNESESAFDSQLSFQRVSETQIKISTVTDSITVDSSVEAVRFYDGNALNEVRLPWIMDERARDLYYSTGGSALSASANISPSNAYVPASEFADFIDLNDYPLQSSTVSSIHAGGGNDIVYGSRDGSAGIRTIRGGDGNDWVYGGAFVAESIADRFELYGDAGNDTITLDASAMQGGVDNLAPRVLLDGGAGSDHYRVSLSELSDVGRDSPLLNIRIADSGGAPTPTAADKNTDKITFTSPSSDEDFSMQWMWEGNELRLLRIDGNDDGTFSTRVYLSANVGTIEQMFVTGDDLYFSADLLGGNLVNPNAAAYASGILKGGDGADVLLSISGMSLNYDGGKGDDLIILNGFTGGVATGGEGNNRILVDDYTERNPVHSLSYTWTAVGHTAEIDLSSGYSFVIRDDLLVASDRFDTGYFANVLGGAGNETIKGSDTANRIDGGGGDDILFSGQNALTQASPEVSDWRSIQPPLAPVRDVLIGGAGNDILVEEAHWGSRGEWNQQPIGSLLDGGLGNDVYVIQHNGAPAGWVTPTRIVERNSNVADGGLDTIRFATSEAGAPSYSFVQTGNTVRVTSSAFDDIAVGDSFLAAFSSGSTLTNIYTVSALIKDSNSNVMGFEFLTPNTVTQTGSLGIVMDPAIDGMGVWADANTFALFSSDDANKEALDAVQDGKGMIEDFDGNSLISELPVQALIDRNAMDFMEFGTADPLVAGVRLPVSFNVGKSAGLEVVMAGANGDAFLYGGAGTDMMIDSAWSDILIGGNGHDVLSSNFGQDILLGGAGNDSLRYRADGQVLVGGAGADSFVLRGLGGAAATVTDFKPWEGDKLIFDSDWLDEFLSHKDLTNGNPYENLSVSFDPQWTNSDDHVTFKLSYDWSVGNQDFSGSVEFLNVSISADHDRAWDQVDEAFTQLQSSLLQSPPM